MPEVFTWKPLINPTGTVQFRGNTARFGDGYGQYTPDGINNRDQSWPLTFRGRASEMDAIADFLDAHKGVSFLWTPPRGPQALFRCGSYQYTPGAADRVQITATFEQWFSP